MKIFVLKRNHLIIYSLIAVLTIGLITYNLAFDRRDKPASATNTTEELPIYCVDTQEKKIAITFDCAWEDTDTDKIIAILKKYNAKATFFAVGEWLTRCEASAKKYAEAGHEIMNHSDAHKYPTKQSKEELLTDIAACGKKIENITGKTPRFYRPPYGDYNATVVKCAREAGYQTVQWSVDSLDWKDITVEEIYKRTTTKIKPGDILLFHTGKKNTPAALDMTLNKLEGEGYTFVLTSELVYEKDYTIDANGVQKQALPTVIETFD
jgi:polysaccharide deacetylase family sporulation protein PdaB